ncbi:AAA family ATPase [Bacillus sp. NP157]|nr:AAA family ATPase [Bacillus sp. NP157]
MTDYAFVSARGGSGKTTLALNFAGLLASRGERVLLVDDDESGGAALAFGALARRAGHVLPFAILPALSRGFESVVHDCSPGVVGRARRLPGDVLIMPTLCDQASHVLLFQALEDLQQAGRLAVVVPNRVRLDRADQARLLADQFPGQAYFRDRAALAQALSAGTTLFCPGNSKSRWAAAARDEFCAAMAPVLSDPAPETGNDVPKAPVAA